MQLNLKKISKLLLILSLIMFSPVVLAEGSVDQDEEEQVIEEEDAEEEKISASVRLEYFQVNNDSSYVKVRVFYREGREIKLVPNVLVNLYLNENSKEGMMGSISTDQNGRGSFILPSKFYSAIKTGDNFTLLASIVNDEVYEDTETEIEIIRNEIVIETYEEDETRFVKATVYSFQDGEKVPVEDAEVYLYVKRMFSLLPLTDGAEYTDSDGEVIIEFPKDIPGDALGNLVIVARIEDHDDFGNAETSLVQNWGVTITTYKLSNERTLWSSAANAPVWLIVSTTSIVFGIWIVIFYLFLLLFKIKKLSKTH
jgi:hypothetical protein